MILALDTSTDIASVALSADSNVLAETTWWARARHSSTLMESLEYLFSIAGISAKDVTAVVVAIGPGSFNGLRVGVSAGKGMALARKIPLVGVSTLDVLAFGASGSGERVWATIPAGRGEVCVAGYEGEGNAWKRISEYVRLDLAAAVGMLPDDAVVSGPAGADVACSAEQLGRSIRVLPSPWNIPRASFLAELGRRYLDAGGESQLDTVEPLYLRRSAAEEKRIAASQE